MNNPRVLAFPQNSDQVRQLAGAFKAARSDPSRHNWQRLAPQSADADLLPDREALVSRSRDAFRNDPFAARALNALVSNIVGTGFSAQSLVTDGAETGLTPLEARTIRREQEAAFARWTPACDATGRLNFSQFLALCERSALESGDALVQFATVRRPEAVSPLALYLIESERIASPGGDYANPNIRGGVELGAWDNPVAWHIRAASPGDYWNPSGRSPYDFSRLPAFDSYGRPLALHYYEVLRPGQTRGIPAAAAVLTRLKDLDDFLEAQIQKNIAAASVVWVHTQENPDADSPYSADPSLEAVDQYGTQIEDIQALSVYKLPRGEDLKSVSSEIPDAAFAPFIKTVQLAIAAGFNLPYELLTYDFSQANYTNLRGAFLEFRRWCQYKQKNLSGRIALPVWERFQEDAYLRGLWGSSIDPARFYENRAAFLRARFLPQPWDPVDPQKDAAATRSDLEARLVSYRDIFAARGLDFEEEAPRIAADLELLTSLGIGPVLAPGAGAALADPANPEPSEPEAPKK